jgi:tRNA-dihydrouridine synthase B
MSEQPSSSIPSTLTLGALTLQSPFLLAPLEGVSDVGFRRLCFEQGAGLTFTEMIRAKALARRNKSTLELIDTFHDQVLTGIQLLATSATELEDALGVVDDCAKTTHPHFKNLRAIDLNFGCPSKDIVQIGAGPAMLKRRAKLTSIIEALAKAKGRLDLNIGAVSCKIRLGLNAKEMAHKVYLPVVEAASSVGLDFITIHARHAGMRSRDPAQWEAIAEAKNISRIPVIGNGDVKRRADAEKLHQQSHCDGFLIARGAIENPYSFRELRGLGAATPTADDVERERVRYEETATRGQTKEKYRLAHADTFARLRRVASGESVKMAMPKNAHM